MIRKQIFFMVFLCFLFIQLPYIGLFLRATNTMIHESGHAIVTLLTHGEVSSISLFATTEGVTNVYTHSQFSDFLVGIAGYLSSSICAYLLILQWKKERYSLILYFFLLLIIVNLLLWVRNIYGILWLIVAGIMLFFTLRTKIPLIYKWFSLLLIIVVLTDAVWSTIDLVQISFESPKTAGDASLLAEISPFPSQAWSIFFLCQSLFFAYLSLQSLFKRALYQSYDKKTSAW